MNRSADLEAIYRARYPAFLRVAVAVVGDEGSAEEAVHDGFVRALRHRRGFLGQGAFEAWVWRIVVNEALRRRTTSGRFREATTRAAADARIPVAAPDAGGDGAVVALVAALPERQRLVLFLRYYADLDYEAIAIALGVKAGTVAATLHQAHAALRRELVEVGR